MFDFGFLISRNTEKEINRQARQVLKLSHSKSKIRAPPPPSSSSRPSTFDLQTFRPSTSLKVIHRFQGFHGFLKGTCLPPQLRVSLSAFLPFDF
jgi:hypothetical protein